MPRPLSRVVGDGSRIKALRAPMPARHRGMILAAIQKVLVVILRKIELTRLFVNKMRG